MAESDREISEPDASRSESNGWSGHACLDTSLSRMHLVIPLASVNDHGGAVEVPTQSGGRSGFESIDADLDLPALFFGSLAHWPIAAVGGQFTPVDGSTCGLGDARIIGVDIGDRPGYASRFFLDVRLNAGSDRVADWLDVARYATKVDECRRICAHFGLAPRAEDTHGTLVASFQLTGDFDAEVAETIALHFSSRAPSGEVVRLSRDESITEIADRRFRIVTNRNCGFVNGFEADSRFFSERFPAEIGNQYVLAVILTRWQLGVLEDLTERAGDIWQINASRRGLVPILSQSRTVRLRAAQVEVLRRDYAQLVATGSLGPVFNSGSQGAFWRDVQHTSAVHQRREETREALSALSELTETQASLGLERLLAFFTLVIGVPSLAFTILGVNIDRLTSDFGISGRWVLALLLLCLVVGAAAFLAADSTRGHDDGSERH